MQIEQKISEQSIDSILKDPKKYRKMMLIMEQTLYDLGYHQSAKMLESQSGVNYYTPQLLQIKSNLDRNDFEGAIKVVQGLDIMNGQDKEHQQNTINHNHVNGQLKDRQNSTKIQRSALAQTKSMIYQTYCMHKIINKQFESAMTIISQNVQSEAKKQFLCQALVLGNHHVTGIDLQRKKSEIFKYCLSSYQQIGQREMQKVIESYSQHQGEYNKELQSLLSSQRKLPPMKVLTVQFSNEIKHTITHLRINLIKNQLVVIQQNKETQQIHIMEMSTKNYDYQRQMSESGHLSLKLKYPIFQHVATQTIELTYKSKRQSIECLSLNSNKQRPLIAIASFNIVQVYSHQLEMLSRVQSPNKIEKFLHLEFHPISELLYNCGYYETMGVMDAMGQQIMSIYPYPKTRKFKFLQNEVLGISLVSNKIYKHSLDEQVLIKERELDDGVMPMDVCINQENTRIAVSSLQFLYIIDAGSLQILGKTTSPANPSKVIIEVKFYNSFLISLCKNFTSYEIQQDKTQISNTGQINNTTKSLTITKTKEWAGDGTFDISHDIMVSGMRELVVWEEGDLESEMEEESEFYEEMHENSLFRDMENAEEDDSMDSESQLDSNSIEEEDDSPDEDDQDIQI